jgi:hypothetical protein
MPHEAKLSEKGGVREEMLRKRHDVTVKQISPYNSPRRPRGGVDICIYSFLNLGARWAINATPRAL